MIIGVQIVSVEMYNNVIGLKAFPTTALKPWHHKSLMSSDMFDDKKTVVCFHQVNHMKEQQLDRLQE